MTLVSWPLYAGLSEQGIPIPSVLRLAEIIRGSVARCAAVIFYYGAEGPPIDLDGMRFVPSGLF